MFDHMNRRSLLRSAVAGGAAAGAALVGDANAQSGQSEAKPRGASGRISEKYRFDDSDMDLFFVIALGWGQAGGLSVGQGFYVASKMVDGDADSWVAAFTEYGDYCTVQADEWQKRGWIHQSGQMRLNAFASYRSAWQFAPVGDPFKTIYTRMRAAYAPALHQLGLPATFFNVPYKGKSLPGVYVQSANPNAPVVLLIGGSDTCFEEIFLTVGRSLWEFGYSVAMADLPGQGITMADGLHWEVESEKPVSAIVDLLVGRFQAVPGRIAMLGYSLGGYFACRTAGYEHRFGAVIASTPMWNTGQVVAAQAKAQAAAGHKTSTVTRNNLEVMFWKAGVGNGAEMLGRLSKMVADPAIVTVPFLSIAGEGENPLLIKQSQDWTANIRSNRKDLVLLPAATGGDAHVQANNRLRLAQEMAGWLSEVIPS